MKKILTFGVFDYFHIGHLRLFKQCREYGDYLIVGVQNSDYAVLQDPDKKMLYSTDERVEMIESLRIVDEVFVYNRLDTSIMESTDFDILALGEDHIGDRFDMISDWCRDHGKSIVHMKRTPGICSSTIKNSLS